MTPKRTPHYTVAELLALDRPLKAWEIVGALKVNDATFYRQIKAGEIPSTRIGRTILIPREWLLSVAGNGALPSGGKPAPESPGQRPADLEATASHARRYRRDHR